MDSWMRFIHWCRQPTMIKLHTFNPGLTRVELNMGAKVGAVSGVISGAVFAPLSLLLSWIIGTLTFRPNDELGQYVSFERYVADTFLSPYFVTHLVPSIILGVIAGVLFGSLFIVLYDKLPGNTPTMKGIVTGIIYWAAAYPGFVLLSGIIMGGFFWGGFDSLVSFFTNINHGGPIITVGLGTSLLWGWLLGRFWTSERLGKH
jgi:hypothetical protein